MIIFITTEKGFDELKPIIKSGCYPLWYGKDILSSEQIDFLESSEIDVNEFNYSIDVSDRETIDCALQTIAEHHPDKRVWMEFKPKI